MASNCSDGLTANLRSPSEIPLKYRHIFSQYETFNQVQSKVLDKVLYSNDPIVISAPTGSGKTAIFELAILRLLLKMEDLDYTDDFKIIYVAPVKALCMEKFTDWREKFEPVGVKCLEATGDSEVGDFSSLVSAKLVVTTPEKWDSLTRKWRDAESMMEAVKLFIIDEVHLVNEDVRGPTLEAVVSRMKTIRHIMKTKGEDEDFGLRFIAASATIPNIEDVAAWLGEEQPACFYRISESLRPVKLQKHVIGFNSSAQGFRFDMNLNYKLAAIVRRYSNDKPTLIFCSSRKSVEMASKVLADESSLVSLGDSRKLELQQVSRSIQDSKLKQLVMKGIAYHHAGLSYQDRAIIEDAFRKSIIVVLVCTNTLAMGVNFPAHLVIIKSTENYVCGKSREYTESAILQMIGRAGRPQYDLTGVAVIMTQQKNVKRYENLVNGCTPIESHLHKYLAEHLNSEIVLQTVTDLTIAMKWIRSTFLYVRAVKCPQHYGFADRMAQEDVEKKLEEMVVSQMDALERCGLVVKDQTFGFSIASTNIGRLMARYYVPFESIRIFWQLQGDESFLDVFNTIISCRDFSEFTLRVSDKKILNGINNHPIRFPIKGKIKTSQNKISCLIQALFDNIHIQDPSMMQDAHRMVRIGEKLSKCLSEYIRLSGDNFCGKIYKTFTHSIILSKCFKAKLWNNTPFVSKQLKNIGPVYSALLVNAGKTTIQSIRETDPRRIEMILGKAPPFGDQIIEMASALPQYDMKLIRKSDNYLEITVEQKNEKFNYEGLNALIVVGDADNNLLFFNAKVDQTICEENVFRRTFPLKDGNTRFVQAKLIHECLVGVDMDEKLVLNFEDELVDSKHAKSKPVTKARTRTRKITKYLAKKSNEDEDTIKALLDNDDDFDNIDIKILDNAIFDNSLQNESRDTPSKNVKECQQSPAIERPLTEFTERPLKCFEYIPAPKLSNTEIATKTLETSLANTLDAVKDSILGEQISDKDPAAAGNEIIQQLFENKHKLEEDFINSQISKDTAVERSDNSISIVDGNGPEELKTHKYSGQITAGGDKFEEAERISNEDLGLGNCGNANADSIISDSLTESENNPSNQLKVEIEESKRSDCSFTMKDSNKNNWKVENIDRISPGKLSTTRNSPEQHAVSDQTSTSNIKRQIPTSKTENVTNLSKLKNLHNPKRLPYRSLTPAARSVGLVKEDYLNMRSKSCYFKDKAVKSLQPGFRKNSSEITLDSRDTKVPNWKDLKDFQVVPSQSKTVSTIFQNSKLNQPKVSGDQIISVFNQLCDKYLGKENVNSKTKDFLKKIEEELSSENETNMETSRRISEFLDKIAVDKEHLQHKSLYQPSSTVTSEKHDPVIRQPLFNKVLSYKKSEYPRTEKAFTKLTNPENDRIDKLLENVIQEPKNQIPPQKCNPYRMKIPKRQRNINMGCASKQNFEYFENLKRKADLEELNRTFSNRSDRNETYLSEMSRIMFADRKKVKLGNEGNYLNIAALPKPDFKAIEEEELRRSIVAEISGECIANPNPVKKFEDYIDETDRGLTNLFEGFEDLSYENEIGFKLPEQTNFDFFGENCQQVGFDPSFFQTSSFVSPSEFSDDRVDTFQLPCFNTDIKSEPVSQSFEPLSLLNDTEDDDMLLNYVQVKSEATERDIIDLTSPVIGGSAYTPFSVGSSQDTIDKELFAQFEDNFIFE